MCTAYIDTKNVCHCNVPYRTSKSALSSSDTLTLKTHP